MSSSASALLPGFPLSIARSLRKGAVFIVLLALALLFSAEEPAFATPQNLLSVLQAVAVVTILGVGVTLSMAVGGFDLSAGALAASTVMATSYAMVVWHLGALGAVLFGIGLGLAVGVLNALLIVWLRVPDLLATLAVNFLLTGLQLIPTAGRSIAPGLILPSGDTAGGAFDPAFLALGRTRLFELVPLPVLIMLGVALLAGLFTERTRHGRMLFATGGNELAARLAGIPTTRLRVAAYVLSGGLAALGGIIVSARIGRGDVSSGASLLLDAVAAALIGHAVLNARRPNVFGTVVGAIFVGLVLNGLTMLNAPFYTQDFVKGAVLVGALALTYGSQRDAA